MHTYIFNYTKYINTCMHTYIHIHIDVYIHTYMFTNVYVHIYIYIHMYVYMYVFTPVGDVEASQVVGGVAEEVQQGEARLGHHLRHCLVAVVLWDNQATVTTPTKSLLTF